MKYLATFFLLLIIASFAYAQSSNQYLIKIDRGALSKYYDINDATSAVQKLSMKTDIFYTSNNYILAVADEVLLREFPKNIFSLLDTFPPKDNWYLLTKLSERVNKVTKDMGVAVTNFDQTILIKSKLNESELSRTTELPFVKMDFTPMVFNNLGLMSVKLPQRVNFGNLLDQVNADSISWFIQQLQDFGTRNAYADNTFEVATWIKDQFIRFGISNTTIEQFNYNGTTQNNVVAAITGSLAPDKYIIIGGHHDSIVFDGNDPTITAPGADDNASGAVAALEMARIMKANNYQPECSIRFVTFAAEEYGLWGSKNYAQNALQQAQDIKLMINHDMIANSTQNATNWLVRMMPYEGFEGYAAYAMNVIDTQTTLTPYAGSLNSAGSDSYSFWQRGFPSIYFFEHQFSPYYHSINDVFANINPLYAKEVIKASTAVCVTYDQIPSPVDYVDIMDTGTGNSLQASWGTALPESDVVSYKLYVTDDISVTPVEYTTSNTTFIVPNLVDGTMYYIGVAAVDNDNNEGLARFVTETPHLLPQTPIGFHDSPGLHTVTLHWEPNNELDLAGYRIYRSTSIDGPYSELNTTPMTSTSYTDTDVADIVYYYYKLMAVDLSNNESVPTDIIRSRAVTLNQGILIVDETMNNTGNTVFAPNDLLSDQFYDIAMHDFQTVQYDIETEPTLKLADIGIYSSILWHGNDSGNLNYPYLVREEVKKYLQLGGKILISSYFPSKAFDNNNNYPYSFESGNFMFDTFGIQQVAYNTSARFMYALPETSGFPALTVDSLKTVLPLADHIYNIESIGSNVLSQNIYYYGSDYSDSTSQGIMNGMPVGVYNHQGTGESVVLSFPLYNMKQNEVRTLMYYVFSQLFGETVSNEDQNITPLAGFVISNVYPNPFSSQINMQLRGIKVNKPLKAVLFNIKGQKIKTLFSGTAKSAEQNLTWDGRDDAGNQTANSIYFIKVEQGSRFVTQKIIKLK